MLVSAVASGVLLDTSFDKDMQIPAQMENKNTHVCIVYKTFQDAQGKA